MDALSSNQYSIGLNPDFKIKKYRNGGYHNIRYVDSFQRSPSASVSDEKLLRAIIVSNPEIKKILTENNLPLKLNMAELRELMEHHAKDTTEIAAAIAGNLPESLKQNVDMYTLKEGAMLHDIGKVLIPAEILNKPEALTEQEYKIMNLHGELGYLILKNSGFSDKTLKLVRHHHNPYNSAPDINLQILNLADKYSALTEQRVYKKAFTPKKALAILYSEVQDGQINPVLFKALVSTTLGKETHKPTKPLRYQRY